MALNPRHCQALQSKDSYPNSYNTLHHEDSLSQKENKWQFHSAKGGTITHFSKMYSQARDRPVSVHCNLKDCSATDSPGTDLNHFIF